MLVHLLGLAEPSDIKNQKVPRYFVYVFVILYMGSLITKLSYSKFMQSTEQLNLMRNAGQEVIWFLAAQVVH